MPECSVLKTNCRVLDIKGWALNIDSYVLEIKLCLFKSISGVQINSSVLEIESPAFVIEFCLFQLQSSNFKITRLYLS